MKNFLTVLTKSDQVGFNNISHLRRMWLINFWNVCFEFVISLKWKKKIFSIWKLLSSSFVCLSAARVLILSGVHHLVLNIATVGDTLQKLSITGLVYPFKNCIYIYELSNKLSKTPIDFVMKILLCLVYKAVHNSVSILKTLRKYMYVVL